MLKKLNKDGLLFHKIGLVVGAILGFIGALIISKKTDEYEWVDLEIEKDDETKSD